MHHIYLNYLVHLNVLVNLVYVRMFGLIPRSNTRNRLKKLNGARRT